MLKIEIKSRQVDEHSGISSKTNKPYTIRKQRAYAVFPDKEYPVEIEISLEDTQNPYDPGDYLLDLSSFFVNKYSQLALGRLKLQPVPSVTLPKIKAA